MLNWDNKRHLVNQYSTAISDTVTYVTLLWACFWNLKDERHGCDHTLFFYQLLNFHTVMLADPRGILSMIPIFASLPAAWCRKCKLTCSPTKWTSRQPMISQKQHWNTPNQLRFCKGEAQKWQRPRCPSKGTNTLEESTPFPSTLSVGKTVAWLIPWEMSKHHKAQEFVIWWFKTKNTLFIVNVVNIAIKRTLLYPLSDQPTNELNSNYITIIKSPSLYSNVINIPNLFRLQAL